MFIENILGKKSSIRLLRILSLNPRKWFFQKELSDLSGLGMGVTSTTLEELFEYHVIEKELRGRMLFFRLDLESPFAEVITNLFNLEKKLMPMLSYIDVAVISEYISKIENLLKDSLIFIVLFGSKVRGTSGKHSDIDLLVVHKKGKYNKKIKDKSVKISERFDLNISPLILSTKEFKELINSRDPLIENIKNESLVLYGNGKKFRNLITRKDNFIDAPEKT